ncbi:unnamed protein product [Penicillium nalgiovense]|nr:unnamed protein product [Penicillium nalgiovense]
MANKETQTSLSPQSTQSAHGSASMRTMFDDGDPYDVADALESNGGSAEHKPDKSNEKEGSIVDWDGPNDPAWHPISSEFGQLLYYDSRRCPRTSPNGGSG